MMFLRAFAVLFAVLAMGGITASAAGATGTSHQATVVAENQVTRTWHATVKCQIIRISDNNAIGYAEGTGSGNTRQKAITAAERAVPVPGGHYKRHCDPKRVW